MCLVSDIPANQEVQLAKGHYFKTGDVADLKQRMITLMEHRLSDQDKEELKKEIQEVYSWEKIAESTDGIYRSLLGNAHG